MKNYPGIFVRQRHTDRKLMGLPREQCAESKKGHLRCCCNQTGQRMVGGFHGRLLLSANQDLWSDGKTPYGRRFGIPFNGPVIPFGPMVQYHPVFCERPIEITSIWFKSLARCIPWICITRGRNLERRHSCSRHWRIGADGRIWNPRQKAQCKESVNAAKKWKLHIPSTRWNSGENSVWEHPP